MTVLKPVYAFVQFCVGGFNAIFAALELYF